MDLTISSSSEYTTPVQDSLLEDHVSRNNHHEISITNDKKH